LTDEQKLQGGPTAGDSPARAGEAGDTQSGAKVGSGVRLPDRTPEVTLLAWSSSLRHRKPKTFAIGLLATVLVLALTWIAFPGEVGYVVLAALMMGGALGPLYFPVGFRFTNKKAYQKMFFSEDGHRWQDFDEYRVFDDGVYLHLRPSDLRLRYLKGMTIYFGRDNREEVLEHVRRIIQPEPKADGREQGTPS
jgi:hypothetical protein